jgi:hypothetical protein
MKYHLMRSASVIALTFVMATTAYSAHAAEAAEPIVISLPAEGKITTLSNGHTVDSAGIIRDASGKVTGMLTASGQLVDETGKPLDTAKQSEMISLFSKATTTVDTTINSYGIADEKEIDQSNAYVASTDDGVISYSGRGGFAVKTAPSGIGTPGGSTSGGGDAPVDHDKGTDGTGSGGGSAGSGTGVTPPVVAAPTTPPVVTKPPVSGGGGGGGGGGGRGGGGHMAHH